MTRYATWITDLHQQKIHTAFVSDCKPITPGGIAQVMRGEQVDFHTFADGVHAQRMLSAIGVSMQTNAWQTLG